MALVTVTDWQNMMYHFMHYVEITSGLDLHQHLYNILRIDPSLSQADIETLYEDYIAYRATLPRRVQ